MKRPLCMTCALILIFQAVGTGSLFRTGETEHVDLTEKESGSSVWTEQVYLTGTVDRIEEKENVTAVFLTDNQISAS